MKKISIVFSILWLGLPLVAMEEVIPSYQQLSAQAKKITQKSLKIQTQLRTSGKKTLACIDKMEEFLPKNAAALQKVKSEEEKVFTTLQEALAFLARGCWKDSSEDIGRQENKIDYLITPLFNDLPMAPLFRGFEDMISIVKESDSNSEEITDSSQECLEQLRIRINLLHDTERMLRDYSELVDNEHFLENMLDDDCIRKNKKRKL
jgi:hypothetical protein